MVQTAALFGGAVILAGGIASAQITFETPVSYDSGSSPRDVAAADFDGDGDLDFAATLNEWARLSVMRNLGDGTYAPAELTDLPGALHPGAIVAPDFDLDGLPDLAFVSSGTDELWVLHNLGTAHFTVIARVVVGHEPHELAAADLDADGDDDLVVSNQASNSISVVKNLGSGQFALTQTLTVGGGPRCIATGHFVHEHSDTQPHDVVVAAHDNHQLHVLRNDGTGTLVPLLVLSVPNASHPEGVVVDDLDGNGSDDIAACFSQNTTHKIGVFYQTHHGAFAEPACFNVGSLHPTHIVAGDFDLDTRNDLATISSDSSQVSILRKLENGEFGMQGLIDLPGPQADHLAAGDFDADHMLDLVCTNNLGSTLSVLINTRTNPSTYCYSAPNSAGSGALIGSTGIPSVSANRFTITVTGAPPNMNGLFFYGRKSALTTYLHGYLCIANPVVRLRPVAAIDRTGTTQYVLDFDDEPVGFGPAAITAGSVWNFQFWYRDIVAGTGNLTNFSNALRVVFEP